MRFGLALPHYDYSFPDEVAPVAFERVAEVAQVGERLGFSSVWISDHFFLSLAKYGAGDTRHGSLEPFTALAGLVSATDRIRLGTLVASAPFRHPAIVANMAATIDQLSGGRFDLGVGAGWFGDEFPAFGYPFETTGERFAELEDHLSVLDTLLGRERGPADLETDRFTLRGASIRPGPAGGEGIPIWLGAKGGPRSLSLAARFADGWNTAWRWTPPAYAERSAEADRACESIGRDPASLRRSVGLPLLMGVDRANLDDRWRVLQAWTPDGAFDAEDLDVFALDTLTGTPERVHALIAAYEDLGVEQIIVNAASMPFALSDVDQLEMFSEEIIRVFA
ncbi:MAG: LLM class flavin-dependent oxidoreductase [Actinomycetota bacterium]